MYPPSTLHSPTSDAHAAVAQRSPEIKLVQPTNDNFRSTFILLLGDGWVLNMTNNVAIGAEC